MYPEGAEVQKEGLILVLADKPDRQFGRFIIGATILIQLKGVIWVIGGKVCQAVGNDWLPGTPEGIFPSILRIP